MASVATLYFQRPGSITIIILCEWADDDVYKPVDRIEYRVPADGQVV